VFRAYVVSDLVGGDLTATAAGNSPARQAQAREVLEKAGSGELQRFRWLAALSAFSTNVDFDKVVVYDDAGEVLDTRGYYAERHGDIAAGLRAFAEKQGSWLARREAFEDLWEYGRTLIYGAVNAGGMGVMGSFGPICLVVPNPDQQSPRALAAFPADTAARYTDASGTVDERRAQEEVTAWAARGELALIERQSEAMAASATDWPRVLCCPTAYLEATFAGSLPLRALSEVRLLDEVRAHLRKLRLRLVAGETLTDTEQNELGAYDRLQRWRREHGTAIVVVT
jgi:hypothetical protein